MPATKTSLQGGGFQDSEGNTLANGYLIMELSQDATVTGVGNVAAGIAITIQLDGNGNVLNATSPGQQVWANDVLLPVNTFYIVTGYTAAGQPAWGPNNQQVMGGSPFNLGSWIPNQVIRWIPSTQSTSLEVNGVPNVNQSVLNLESTDSSVTITDAGGGSVNLQVSGGSAPSGSNVALIPPYAGGAGNLGGYTIIIKIPASMVSATGSGVKVGLSFYSGVTPVITSASIAATLPNATPSVSGYTYNYAWTTAPISLTWSSLTSNMQPSFSNRAAITIDANHDYYIMVYLAAGLVPYLFQGASTIWSGLGGYISGDHHSPADASTVQSFNASLMGFSSIQIA